MEAPSDIVVLLVEKPHSTVESSTSNTAVIIVVQPLGWLYKYAVLHKYSIGTWEDGWGNGHMRPGQRHGILVYLIHTYS